MVASAHVWLRRQGLPSAAVTARARTRIGIAIGVVVILAAVGAGVYLTRSGSHSTSAPAGKPNRDGFQGNFNGGEFAISDGMKPKDVLDRLGPPNVKSGPCWIYRIHKGQLAGYTTEPIYDAVRFCFLEGVVSHIEDLQRGQWLVPEYVSPPVCTQMYGADLSTCAGK